jgi:SEC-C motif-containing protein
MAAALFPTPAAMISPADPCPCGRTGDRGAPRAYAGCCGRYIDHWDDAPAPDAESLMRSRYTAFVRGHADYLRATWHASTRPATLDLDPGARWLGLEVRGHQATGPEQAEVEFVARYRVGGRAVRLHERSRFVREAGRWYYVDGDIR